MSGYIFNIKSKYFFVKSDKKNKNASDAKKILNYFIETTKNAYSEKVLETSFEIIKNNIQKVNITRSNDFKFYYIHGKDFGATIEEKDMIIIE